MPCIDVIINHWLINYQQSGDLKESASPAAFVALETNKRRIRCSALIVPIYSASGLSPLELAMTPLQFA
jgi:hypothetical protein